jgi:fructoselysine-6-P-deglycase FrlB-like protein
VVRSGDGALVGEARLEEPPIARPAVGDFNNDGTNDVIIVSANAYYAYSLSTQSASLFLPTLLFLLLLAIASLAVYQRRHESPSAPALRREKRDI